MQPLTVTFLGSGDAFNARGRHHAACLLRGAEVSLLLDCGATALASMKKHGIRAGGIDTVLLSHLHGDHFAGLPFLILEYIWLEKRNRPLRIIGPPGTKRRVPALLEQVYPGTAAEPLPFTIELSEVEADGTLTAGPTKIVPFAVPHQEHELSLGYVVEAEGHTIVYSGDTGWTEELVIRTSGADLFICECSFYETRAWFHLDYPRLAENRSRFGAKRIVLTHLGEEVLRHRNDIDFELAEDGLTIQI